MFRARLRRLVRRSEILVILSEHAFVLRKGLAHTGEPLLWRRCRHRFNPITPSKCAWSPTVLLTSSNVVSGFANSCVSSSKRPITARSVSFSRSLASCSRCCALAPLNQTRSAMAYWFCDAYASWQKGGVENANGRLRRWLPRHVDIDRLSDADIQDIVITANLTPRKCLGFKTPFQAILKELGKDAQIRFS